MDKTIEDRCYAFYYGELPDAPAILDTDGSYAEYDYKRDVILIPTTAQDVAWRFNLVMHEYGHRLFLIYLQKKLYKDILAEISYCDYFYFSEIVAEIFSLLLCKEIGLYGDNAKHQTSYIKSFITLIEDKTLLPKILLVVREIASRLLGKDGLEDNLPPDVIASLDYK